MTKRRRRGGLGVIARARPISAGAARTAGILLAAWLLGPTAAPAPAPVPAAAPAPAALPQVRKSHRLTGYALGAGFESFVRDWLRLKAEYLFLDLDDWRFWAHGKPYRIDPSAHVVRVGVVVPFKGL